MDLSRTGDYCVTFLSRHLAGKYLCDNVNCWWSEWNEFYLDEENIPLYGYRMIFKPNRKPNLAWYMLWTDSVHLTNPSFLIH